MNLSHKNEENANPYLVTVMVAAALRLSCLDHFFGSHNMDFFFVLLHVCDQKMILHHSVLHVPVFFLGTDFIGSQVGRLQCLYLPYPCLELNSGH